MPSHYHTLKVAPDAPLEVIRAAYRVLAARHHPDRCAGDGQAPARMQRINEAWRVLSDPASRAAHDAALQRQRRRRASDGAQAAAAAGTPVGVAGQRPDAVDAANGLRRRAAAAYAAQAAIAAS